MKLNEALQRVIITVKNYIDKVTPTKLSDLEIDIEVGTVKTINGNEPDENGNVEIQTGNPNALLFSEQNLTEEQKTQARANIGTIDAKAVDDALALKADVETVKPKNLIANIEGSTSYDPETDTFTQVITCDVSFEDLWTNNEEGRDVIFNIMGYSKIKGEFHFVNTSNGKVRQIHIRDFSTTNYTSYVIAEDNTITKIQANLLNKNQIKQETGTSSFFLMSQKAITDALALKVDGMSNNEIIELLTETGFISPLTNANGDVYTNSKGDVYVL